MSAGDESLRKRRADTYRALPDLQASILAADIADMIHSVMASTSMIPVEVSREAIRKCLTAREYNNESNPLIAWVQIKKISAKYLGKSLTPDGKLLTEDEVAVIRRALSGRGEWRLEDAVHSNIENLFLRQIYANSVAHYAAQDHYNQRRKEANAAIARKSTREEVFARHGEACLECGSKEDLCLDHIVPVTLGGTDDIENLQVLCRSCNSSKGGNLEVQNGTSRDLGRITGVCDRCGDTEIRVTKLNDSGHAQEGICLICNQSPFQTEVIDD